MWGDGDIPVYGIGGSIYILWHPPARYLSDYLPKKSITTPATTLPPPCTPATIPTVLAIQVRCVAQHDEKAATTTMRVTTTCHAHAARVVLDLRVHFQGHCLVCVLL